jgi:hypothetical protein
MLKMKAKPKKDMGHLYKATNHVRGLLVLIWLTLVTYIVYVEYCKTVTIG